MLVSAVKLFLRQMALMGNNVLQVRQLVFYSYCIAEIYLDSSFIAKTRTKSRGNLSSATSEVRYVAYFPSVQILADTPAFPKYTERELREIDDYAFALGIEVIACIQTLGHLGQMLQWPKHVLCFLDKNL